MRRAITLGELLTKLGYDHVLPQPYLVNMPLIIQDPLSGGDKRQQWQCDLAVPANGKLYLHMGEEIYE